MMKWSALLLAAAIALAACGDDDNDNGDDNGTGGITPVTDGVSPGGNGNDPPPAESDGNAPGIPALQGDIQEKQGLRYIDEVVGDGEVAENGDIVSVNYTGWLSTGGDPFDTSLQPGRTPLRFIIGTRNVIMGWELGLEGMREGGKRRLIIPPELGYGAEGSPPAIPGGSTLIFDVELVEVLEQ